MKDRKEVVPCGMTKASLIFAVIGASVAILVYFIIPNFKQTFDSFGSELPLLTEIVLNAGYNLVWASVLCIVLAGANMMLKSKPAFYISCIYSLCLILLLPVSMVAMYLPIFQMGQP